MTSAAPSARTGDDRGRAFYRRTANRCRRSGLCESAIGHAAASLCEPSRGRWLVTEAAYRPTGVALGSPLPDVRTTRHLWRVANHVERTLKALVPAAERWFAYVPADWYHMTVVNRTHYRVSSTIRSLTREEFREAEALTRRIVPGPITIILSGLILSQQGVLLVPGFPADDTLHLWRARMASEVPELAPHTPPMAHIKLGHVLAMPPRDRVQELLARVAQCGQQVAWRLRFTDAYTPLGRIALPGCPLPPTQPV